MKNGNPDTRSSPDQKLILVGNPNVGKSVIFGLLTGKYVTVSNYPGTTVEVTTGVRDFGKTKYTVIDTPGVNTLVPTSEDEQVTRNILITEEIQVVLQVADAKNLRRALLLTLQLAEMGVPIVLCLNMADEAKSRGIKIDIQRLSDILRIDVIPTVAPERKGTDLLIRAIPKARTSSWLTRYDPGIENGIESLEHLLPKGLVSPRSLALMLLSGDESIKDFLKTRIPPEDLAKIEGICASTQEGSKEPLNLVINLERMRAVDEILDLVFCKIEESHVSWKARFGRLTMEPIPGTLLALLVIYLFWLFVGKFGAGICVDFLEHTVFEQYLNPWLIRIASHLPWELAKDLLVGKYGLLTMALTYSLGIILPIVATFFLAFGLLEDSGYLPRLAVMSDRFFRWIGLNGRAVLPMILGLGCGTMATLSARILETKKERLLVTLLLALAVPCSAQLGVIMAMLGSISAKAMLLWLGLLVISAVLVGSIACRCLPGEGSDFLLEIPPIRAPKLGNIAVKTAARIEWYLKEAVPLFFLGTLLLFAGARSGALDALERIASPVVVVWLALPVKATEAFLIGFLRRDYGAAGLYALAKDGILNPHQVLVSVVTITLFVPCIAQFLIVVKERGLRAALLIAGFVSIFAVFMGGIMHRTLILFRASL